MAPRRDPSAVKWWYLLAVARSRSGQTKLALEALDQVLSLDPDYAPAYRRRGNLLLESGDLDAAEATFLRALEPRPRGRQTTPESQVRALEKEVSRLSRELARTRSLVRVAHRTIGITTPAAPTTKRGSKRTTKADAKPARRRRGVARGEKVAKALVVSPPSDAAEEA